MKRGRSYASTRPAKRRRRTSYAPSARSVVPVARSNSYYAAKNAEIKFYDVATALSPVPQGGTILNDNLVKIAVGTGQSERIGRKIVVQKVQLKYSIFLPSTATFAQAGQQLRVILYVDKQTNGAAATSTQILASALVRSYRKLDNIGRFTILMDKLHTINGTGGTATTCVEQFRNYSFFKNVNIPIEYDQSVSTTGDIAELRSNNIGILLVSGSGQLDIDTSVRIRYSDNS